MPDTTHTARSRYAPYRRVLLVGTAASIGCASVLVTIGFFDYLLFHALVEITVTATALAIAGVSLVTRTYADDDTFTALGAMCAGVAIVTVLHVLAYKGMAVINVSEPVDFAAKLWLASRLLEAAGITTAALLVGKRLAHPSVVWLAFVGAALGFTAAIWTGNFPLAFHPETGLTPFKIITEYAVSACILAVLILLWTDRSRVARRVLVTLTMAGTLFAMSGLAFTLYDDATDISNMIGHLLVFGGCAALFVALVVILVRNPIGSLYRKLRNERRALAHQQRYSEGTVTLAERLGKAHGRHRIATIATETVLDTCRAPVVAIVSASNGGGAVDSARFSSDASRMPDDDLIDIAGRLAFLSLEGGVSRCISVSVETHGRPMMFVAHRIDSAVDAGSWLMAGWSDGRHPQKDAAINHFIGRSAVIISLMFENNRLLQESKRSMATLRERERYSESVIAFGQRTALDLEAEALLADACSIISDATHSSAVKVLRPVDDDGFEVIGSSTGHVGPVLLNAEDRLHLIALLASPPTSGTSLAFNSEHSLRGGVRLIRPLPLGDGTTGLLLIEWEHADKATDSSEMREYVEKMIALLSLSLGNAGLYTGVSEIAEKLQQGMMPHVDQAPGIEIASAYVPAPGVGRIGGDFYGVMDLRDGLIAFFIGDVAGHGIEAASANAMTRAAISTLAASDPDPSRVLSGVNRMLADYLEPGRFVTAAYGLLDTHSLVLKLALAGHPEPLVWAGPDLTPPAGHRNAPLGIAAGVEFRSWTMRLEHGATLVLYTDGVTEARSGQAMFGVERLAEVVATCAGDPSAIVSTTLGAVENFIDGEHGDDIAILAIRLDGDVTRED